MLTTVYVNLNLQKSYEVYLSGKSYFLLDVLPQKCGESQRKQPNNYKPNVHATHRSASIIKDDGYSGLNRKTMK